MKTNDLVALVRAGIENDDVRKRLQGGNGIASSIINSIDDNNIAALKQHVQSGELQNVFHQVFSKEDFSPDVVRQNAFLGKYLHGVSDSNLLALNAAYSTHRPPCGASVHPPVDI